MAYKELSDLASEREEYDFTEEINKLDAKINPLTVLTNQVKRRGTVDAVTHYWYQEELDNRWDTINGTPASDSTVVTVDNYARFHKWDVAYIPETGWTGICDDDSIDADVEFNVIADGSGAVTDGENILIMGPAIEEGSPGVDAYQGSVSAIYNYTTTLQRSFSITRETEVNAKHGEDELARLQNKKGRKHARDIEYHLWFGTRLASATTVGVTGSAYFRTNGGLFYYLTGSGDGNATNTNIGGALTESAFQTWLFDGFKYTDTLYLFCGEYGLQCIDNWARGKLQMVPKDKSYGLNISQYPLAGRMAYIIDATRLLEAGADADKTDYEGYIVALDLSDIKFFWYTNQATKLYTHVETAKQAPNRREDMYQSQFTLEVGNSKRHAIAYGITGVG